MNNTSFKAFLMFAITFAASLLSTSGFPSTSEGWTVLGVTVVGSLIIYLGKNFAFPSISLFGTIDLRDVLSGLILAIGTGVSNWVGTLVAVIPVDWHSLWVAVGSVVIGYLLKNFATHGDLNPTA